MKWPKFMGKATHRQLASWAAIGHDRISLDDVRSESKDWRGLNQGLAKGIKIGHFSKCCTNISDETSSQLRMTI
jgi:hypothetical protein